MEVLSVYDLYLFRLFLIIVLPTFIALVCIKNLNKIQIRKCLFASLITFLILYFPVLDYWSIWHPKYSIWPEGFALNYSVLSEHNIDNYFTYLYLLQSLEYTSKFLIFFSIPLFINYVNQYSKYSFKRLSYLNWIPIINIFSIGYILTRISKSWSFKLVSAIWFMSTLIWVYYMFIAGRLVMLGVDSYTIIDRILFDGESKVNQHEMFSSPIGYSYILIADFNQIVTPVFIFTSAILSLVIIHQLKLKNKQT